MIQFVNVTKAYDTKDSDLVAVDNVSCEIDDGEFVFLIGPSGSGKTTLIKMLIREETPSSGKVYFDNQDVTVFNRSQIYDLRRKIGVIFQDYKLIEDKTAFENIEFVMEAAGKSEKEIDETVPYLLDIVGLADRKDSFPRELSGGEKQRIAIARALANNPKVLIADEPTGNLDPEAAWEVVQILKKVNDWGTTVIMSTHGSDIVNKINKRVLQMENGILVRDENIGQYKTVSVENREKFEENILANKEELEEEQISEKNAEDKIEEEVIDEKSTTDEDIEDSENSKKEGSEDVEETEDTKANDSIKEDDVVEVAEGPSTTEDEKENKDIQVEIKKEENDEVEKPTETEEVKMPETDTADHIENKDGVEEKVTEKIEKQEETIEEKYEPEPKAENKKFKISLVHRKGKEKIVEKKKVKKPTVEKQIYTLDLPSKLVDILESKGFQTVDKLVNAGIEEVSKIKELDETDIEIIRKSIVNFIQSE